MNNESTGQPCPVCAEAGTAFFITVDGLDYRRCPQCLATFLDPRRRPTAAEERAEYDRHRNDIDDPGYRKFLARIADPLRERLTPGARGLDYGCGPGPALAAMLGEAGYPTAAWDPIYAPDPALLECTYDFITCTEVLEHMHHPATEFRRLDALLRPGGILGIMTTFQTDDARFAGWHYRRDPTHVVFFREHTLALIADRMGWSMESPAANVATFCKPGAPEPGLS